MPRDGGRAQNAVEETHDIAHGVGDEPKTDKVARAETKAAPAPQHEHGAGIEGLNASGGKSQGLAEGDNVGQGGRQN